MDSGGVGSESAGTRSRRALYALCRRHGVEVESALFCPDYLDGGLRLRGRQSEVVRHSRPLSRRPNPWTDTSNSLGAGYHPAAGVSLGGLVQMAGDVTGGPGRKAMEKAENLR